MHLMSFCELQVDNNNHIVPMNTTKTTLLDIDIHNTCAQPMLK